MAEVPEDYDSGPDDDEDLSSETSGWPQILQMAEVTKSDSIMEAGPDLPPEIEEEPWPETEEDDLKAGPSKNFEDIQLTPARTPEEGISKELDVDVPIGIEADTSRETLKEMEGEHFRDGEVLMDEKREEWDLLPKGEIIIHFTEEALTESVMEADHKLPEENKPEVLGSTFSEIKLELPEEPKSEVSEELIGEQDEIVIESPENIEPEFPIDTPRKYVDETNLPPTKMTTSEITEERPKKLTEEQGGESLGQTTPEFLEQKLEKSTEESGLESPEEARPEVPQETQRKSSEEAGLEPPEETRPEVPEETQRKSSEEVGLEPPEEIRPEVPEETQRKSSEEAGLEPPEETRPEVPEETQRKSSEKAGREPPEEARPEVPEPQIKSADKAGQEPPEETKPGAQKETSKMSTEEVGLEPSEEETKPEFPEKALKKSTEKQETGPSEETTTEQTPIKSAEDKQRKSTERVLEEIKPEFPQEKSAEGTGLEPLEKPRPEVSEETRKSLEAEIPVPPKETDLGLPQEIKQEVQEEMQRKSSEDKALMLPDEDILFRGVDPSKDNRPKPIKFQYYEEATEHPKYQMIKFSKEESLIEFHRESEVELRECSSTINESTGSNLSEFEVDLVKFFSETNIADLSEEVKESLPEKAQPRETTELQFEYLHWSPNDVAEWIGHLGFPQYKECFTANFISGRKLIYVNCSNLPQMGITDFEDMKVISGHARDLLGIEEPFFKRSITLPHRDNIGLQQTTTSTDFRLRHLPSDFTFSSTVWLICFLGTLSESLHMGPVVFVIQRLRYCRKYNEQEDDHK